MVVITKVKTKMNVLEVHDASCKDCHRCLRECSVKAIAFEDDQAKIIDEKCIYCGKCVNVCPQDAKVPRSELELFSDYLQSEKKVAVTLAPSFAAAFNLDSAYRIVGALKDIGVDIVAETSQAAEYVASEYQDLVADNFKSLISSCCPAVVNLVEKHYPQLISYLSPIISPMNLHAELLKKKYGKDIKVVFIGPCIAKMDEAENHQGEYNIDAVLTFDYLKEFLKNKSHLQIGDEIKLQYKYYYFNVEQPITFWIEATIIDRTYTGSPIVLYLHPTEGNYQKMVINNKAE